MASHTADVPVAPGASLAEPSALVPELLSRYHRGRLPLDRLVTAYPLGDFDQAVPDQRAGLVLKPVLVPDRSCG